MVKMNCGSSRHGQPAKVWLFMIFVILLLATVIAIRPIERGSRRNSKVSPELLTRGESTINQALGNSEEEVQGIDGEEECKKNEEEEECWNRRTLAAQTDYIYTQKHNGP